MWARVAKFEGDPADVDARVDEASSADRLAAGTPSRQRGQSIVHDSTKPRLAARSRRGPSRREQTRRHRTTAGSGDRGEDDPGDDGRRSACGDARALIDSARRPSGSRTRSCCCSSTARRAGCWRDAVRERRGATVGRRGDERRPGNAGSRCLRRSTAEVPIQTLLARRRLRRPARGRLGAGRCAGCSEATTCSSAATQRGSNAVPVSRWSSAIASSCDHAAR